MPLSLASLSPADDSCGGQLDRSAKESAALADWSLTDNPNGLLAFWRGDDALRLRNDPSGNSFITAHVDAVGVVDVTVSGAGQESERGRRVLRVRGLWRRRGVLDDRAGPR